MLNKRTKQNDSERTLMNSTFLLFNMKICKVDNSTQRFIHVQSKCSRSYVTCRCDQQDISLICLQFIDYP